MADPPKVSIWEERTGSRRRVARHYWRRNSSSGVLEPTAASASEGQYPVAQDGVVGFQPAAAEGSSSARTGSRGVVSVQIPGSPDEAEWYETWWLKSVSGHIEVTKRYSERDAYFTLVSGHIEFTTTDPSVDTLVTAGDPVQQRAYFFQAESS